jgi:hypothetical protein
MASSGKKKTTMAKLNRESKLRERRLDKQARKDARKYAAAHPMEAAAQLGPELGDAPIAADEHVPSAAGASALVSALDTPPDA